MKHLYGELRAINAAKQKREAGHPSACLASSASNMERTRALAPKIQATLNKTTTSKAINTANIQRTCL